MSRSLLEFSRRSLVSILAVLAMFCIKRFTDQYLVFVESPFLFFLSSILLAGWYGGFWQGVFAAFLATLLANFYFFPHSASFTPAGANQLLRLGLFFLNGLFISGLCWTIHRARRSLEQSRVRLFSSENQFHRIYESNMIGLLFAKLDGEVLDANDYILDMLGFTREDLKQGRINWLNLTPPEHMETTRQAIAQMDERDVLRPFEKQYLRKDGTPISVLVGSALLDRKKRLVVTYVLDITERKQSQDLLARANADLEEKVALRTRELVESQNFLDSIIEYLPNMIFIKDAQELRFVRFNKAGEDLIGYGREDLLGKSDHDFFPPDQAAAFIAKDRLVLEGRKVVDIPEEPITTKTGVRTLHTKKIPLIGKDGRPSYLLGVSEDITEKKAAEAQTIKLMEERAGRKEAERTAQQMAFSAEAMRILSSSLNYKETLESFARLVVPRMADWCSIDIVEEGEQPHTLVHVHRDPEKTRRSQEVLAKYPKDWNLPGGSGEVFRTGRSVLYPQLDPSFVERVARSPEHLEHLRSLELRSMMVVPLQVYDKVLGTITFVTSDSGRNYTELDLSFASDFARRASYAIENARLFEKAQEANRAKSAFLANMSHEIRTPLGAMLGFAELTLDSRELRSEEREHVSTIIRNGRQLLRIVNDILDISKVESERLGIEQIQFSFKQLLEDVGSLLRLQAEDKGLVLNIDQGSELPDQLISDPTRLRQILINVIGNAIKFTEKGGVHVRLKALRGPADRSVMIEVSVQDTGLGISAEQAKRLFQPFSQGDSSMTRKFGGTGLGLYLSKRLAQVLGGNLELESSQPGQGSLFRISFKAQEASGQSVAPLRRKLEPSAEGRPVRAPSEDRRPIRVLVVDDAPDNRLLVGHYIAQLGYEVESAEDGQQGVDKALASRFDAVLMDIQMPRMDGFQALRHLRERGYDGPIVALTAHAMKGDRERCLEAGFNSYLVKPIDKASLFALLESYEAEI